MSPFIEPLIGPLIEPGIKSREKKHQKENIRTVIAPEHKHKYKDIENGLKGEEKVLIEQMAQHCEAFKANFKGAAQGEWVKSAMSEIDSIKDDLKNINS
ncbi:hypothetical protein [Staphylococcus aureus]|uniref:hypothetical protein n=1 Tax=Staphylococcus aureus TaxID=1280 RepID=UPI00193A90D4|nr:hypothetical protein [Staphylococcus aureus]